MTMAEIDSTAIVSANALLAPDVVVGAYAVIGANVTIGSGSVVGAFTRIEGPTAIGERNHFYGHASIGGPPQDLKYKGEHTELAIGNDNVFREFVTINRGTTGGRGKTTIRRENFFGACAPIAHESYVVSQMIFA